MARGRQHALGRLETAIMSRSSGRGAEIRAAERVNALTVDVEDYYQVEAFAGVVRSTTSRWFRESPAPLAGP